MFEGWVVSEVVKWHLHRGIRPQISYVYRERDRHEVDLVLEHGAELTLIEAKAGQTPRSEHLSAFTALAEQIAARGCGNLLRSPSPESNRHSPDYKTGALPGLS
jgi:predicted AAA+ superfamily ATPase